MLCYKYSFFLCICILVLPSSSILKDFLFSVAGTSGLTPDYMNNINMILYQGSSPRNAKSYKYSLTKVTELKKQLDASKPFVLYIHGFLEHYANESVQTVLSAYLKKGRDNIVILDWSALAYENYGILSRRVKIISMFTAQALNNLVNAHILNIKTFHIVSHSLGSQLAGFLHYYLMFKIPRITALDPANPLFYQFNAKHIDRTSAKIVDVLHTDGGILGANVNTGSLDFYANKGVRPQPGCAEIGTDLCSHRFSWRIYAESVINEKAFLALACPSYEDFVDGNCKDNEVTSYGYKLSNATSSTYYFTTNAKFPFGKGTQGIKA